MRLAVLIRMFDILFAFLGLGFGVPILLGITILVFVDTKRPFFCKRALAVGGMSSHLLNSGPCGRVQKMSQHI